MKNVLSISVSGEDLMGNIDDGTNRLIINGEEIASNLWVGTGNYTATINGHSISIAKVKSNDGNVGLRRLSDYAYELFLHTSSGKYELQKDGGTITLAGVDGSESSVTISPADIGAKAVQTAVSSPATSGSGIEYIATVSQNAQGVISATKSTVRSASGSQSGVVTTGAQTIAGVKTLTSTPVMKNSATTPGIQFTPSSLTNRTGWIFQNHGTTNNVYRAAGMYFRQYSYNATSGAGLDYYEQFTLPGPTAGRTSNASYSILTSKSAVTVAQGGTGATTAADARTNLGAAASSHNHAASAINSGTLDVARLPTVTVAKGGTGATSASGARTNLGIGFTSLYNGTLTSGSTTLTNGKTYNALVILCRPTSTAGYLSLTVPTAMLTTSATPYQCADEGNYVLFNLSYSGNNVTLAFAGHSNANGAVKRVFGVN